jgi:hypothetical protein
MYSVHKASREDVHFVATHIDSASAQAIELCGVDDIQGEINTLYERSKHTLCVSVNDQPVAIFGVFETPHGDGSAWLIAVNDLPNIPIRLLVHARRFVSVFLNEFPRLRTIVWEKNVSHMRWVEWLGFTKHHAIPYGKNEELFYIFLLEN